MINGCASEKGTRRYAARHAPPVVAEHYQLVPALGLLSSIGIGTYLGEADAATDALYRRAVGRALERGLNLVDTAVNYRGQRSERAVGSALADLIGRGLLGRDEVVVATKGGYLAADAESGLDARAHFVDAYLRPGIVRPEEVVGGVHCMAPSYLRDQIERSRTNLGLETIDIYYVHNPESQLSAVDRPTFLARLREAFAALERAVGEGKITCYGTATWNGYRQPPEAADYVALEDVVEAARQAGGAAHHFKVIQLPYNMAMPEAFTRANQKVGTTTLPAVHAAQRLGLHVVASASVYQGQLTRNLPPVIAEYLPGLATDAQRAIQFVRSTPGVGTALVGMKSAAHVDENAAVAATPPMPWEQFGRLFTNA
jgi:aryl-alcohol dehydrogenase-like predicted oxidoreductase